MPNSPHSHESDSGQEAEYLLVKRDLYWKPNRCGYTGIKSEAGRYRKDEAERICASGDSTQFFHHEDCPAYTASCFDDIKQRDLNRRLSDIVESADCMGRIQADVRILLRDANLSKSEARKTLSKEGKA